jgi:hypothetical protein
MERKNQEKVTRPYRTSSPHSALSTVTVDNFEQVEVSDGKVSGASWFQEKFGFKVLTTLV